MTKHSEAPKVRSVVEDRVARITFSDPATRNAFSAPFLAQLHQALDDATARSDVGSILVSAEGPDFSAGGYLPDLAALPTKTLAETEADGRPIAELFKRLAV